MFLGTVENINKQYRFMKLHMRAQEEYQKMKETVDNDPEIKKECRKIEALIAATGNHDIQDNLKCKIIERKIKKLFELLDKKREEAKTEDDYIILYMIIDVIGSRVNL